MQTVIPLGGQNNWTQSLSRPSRHVMAAFCHIIALHLGGILALRAHWALLLDYVPPEEPLGTPLGNTLRIRRPKLDGRGP